MFVFLHHIFSTQTPNCSLSKHYILQVQHLSKLTFMKNHLIVRKEKFEKVSWEPISQKKPVELKSIVGSGREVNQSSYPTLQRYYSLLVP